MSWLNDLFADDEDQAPQAAAPKAAVAPEPAMMADEPSAAPSPSSSTCPTLIGGDVPLWERGQNGASGDIEGMRSGLQSRLSELAHGYRGQELELIARLQTALDTNDLGLPPFPDTVIKLRGLLDSDGVDSAEISKLVRTDPGLAEEVWRVASSVAMGGKRPKTLQHAVGRLGHQQLWKVAMFVALDEALFQVDGFEEEVLFLRNHGTHVADLAEWLAPRPLKGPAWMAGLLHDSGKLLICKMASEVGIPNNAPVLATLMDQCHSGLGGLVANSWNMPEAASAIAFHHNQADPVGTLIHRADIASHGAWNAVHGLDSSKSQEALAKQATAGFKPSALIEKAISLAEADRIAA
jgi:HD-like signal output (HDOD) protein